MTYTGDLRPSGGVQLTHRRDLGDLKVHPPPPGWRLKNFLKYRRRDLPRVTAIQFLGRLPGVITSTAELRGKVYHADFARLASEQAAKLRDLLATNVDVLQLPRHFGGCVTDYGVLSTRVVTTVGVAFIVDAFQNIVEVENMKFHAFGTGTNAEAAADTALQTEETTQYVTNNTRPTGTTTEGASANIYRTVATYSPDSGGTRAITEHGILDQASNAGGVLLDRSVFSAVNLVASADSLQATYELTFSSGG